MYNKIKIKIWNSLLLFVVLYCKWRHSKTYFLDSFFSLTWLKTDFVAFFNHSCPASRIKAEQRKSRNNLIKLSLIN